MPSTRLISELTIPIRLPTTPDPDKVSAERNAPKTPSSARSGHNTMLNAVSLSDFVDHLGSPRGEFLRNPPVLLNEGSRGFPRQERITRVAFIGSSGQEELGGMRLDTLIHDKGIEKRTPCQARSEGLRGQGWASKAKNRVNVGEGSVLANMTPRKSPGATSRISSRYRA